MLRKLEPDERLVLRTLREEGAIMVINEIIRISWNSQRADKSAVGAMNRPLRLAGGVCPKVSSAPTGGRGILSMCIIGPLQCDGQGGQTPEAHICAPACGSWNQLHAWHTPQQRIESHVSF